MQYYQLKDTVRWSETDASGRFHFSDALIWAENAEHSLCRIIDPDAPLVRMPRRSVSVTYSRPFFAADGYCVELWVEKLGNSSISYAWIILNGTEPAIEGRHTVVHVDDNGQPASIPVPLRKGLEKYLNTSPKG